jgi:hypothetical protein
MDRTWAEVGVRDLPGGKFGVTVGEHLVETFPNYAAARHFIDRCPRLTLRDIGMVLETVLGDDEVVHIPSMSGHPCGPLVDFLRAALTSWKILIRANGH